MDGYITKSIIGIIVIVIVGYGMIKGGKVYEWFIEGAKDGLKVCMNIFPYLLAMIVAVEIFKNANLLDIINNFIEMMDEFDECTFNIIDNKIMFCDEYKQEYYFNQLDQRTQLSILYNIARILNIDIISTEFKPQQ